VRTLCEPERPKIDPHFVTGQDVFGGVPIGR
jgi:hypothetical protein